MPCFISKGVFAKTHWTQNKGMIEKKFSVVDYWPSVSVSKRAGSVEAYLPAWNGGLKFAYESRLRRFTWRQLMVRSGEPIREELPWMKPSLYSVNQTNRIWAIDLTRENRNRYPHAKQVHVKKMLTFSENQEVWNDGDDAIVEKKQPAAIAEIVVSIWPPLTCGRYSIIRWWNATSCCLLHHS